MGTKRSVLALWVATALFAAAVVACQPACLRAARRQDEPLTDALPEMPSPLLQAAPTVEPIADPSPSPSPKPAPSATPERGSLTLPPQEIVRGNRERPEMALTFDCGASAVPTPAILEALRREQVGATFFLTGQWVQQNPALAAQIAAEHEIANHSFSHPDFSRLTNAQILAEMEKAEATILEVTGHSTRPLWRAPFGSRNARILGVVADAGWPYHIYWSADSGDWRDITPQEVRANINAAASNGAIIVQHCGSVQTAAVISDVLRDLKSRGFKLTTVSDLLRE